MVAVRTGTAGLYMSLLQAGVGPGDEVILPVMTFVASANPVVQLDARPVFVDVDPHTWNMDPDAVESAITDRTKVILPVHLYGNPCDMDKIMTLAARHDCTVIEDAAESLGATFGRTMTGCFGAFGAFSFNGNKVITTGGGGAIVAEGTDDEARIRHLINQARDVRQRLLSHGHRLQPVDDEYRGISRSGTARPAPLVPGNKKIAREKVS